MAADSIIVKQASVSDIETLVPLFDAYRQFYRKASDPDIARRFLTARLERGESAVFLALDSEGASLGFVQLYPAFSSAAAAPILILNDLYVAATARRRGIAKRLLKAAVEHARSQGAVRLTLSTETTNHAAQALYEREGWKRQEDFFVYNFGL